MLSVWSALTRLHIKNNITLFLCLFVDKGCYEIVKRRRQTTSSDIGFELSTKLTTKEIKNNSSLKNMDSVEHLK